MTGKINWDVTLAEAVQTIAMLQEGAGADSEVLKVLDVGGAMKPLVFATHIIDILPHYNRAWSGHHPADAFRGAERFTEDTWLQHDICVTPWPYEDDEFDVCFCVETIEDVRDPISAIKEMVRVSKVGYIQTTDRNYESLYNVEDPRYSGYVHHRWLVERDDDKLKFTFKFPLLHVVHDMRPRGTGDRYIELWWSGNIEAYEYIPMSREEIVMYFEDYNAEIDKRLKRKV